MNPALHPHQSHAEKPVSAVNGWAAVLGEAFLVLVILGLAASAAHSFDPRQPIALVAAGVLFVVVLPGFFVNGPNQATVLILFGRYLGTVREPGLRWANPFAAKTKISLRAQSLNGEKIKVNDLRGNPIEIAAVVVWRIRDTAQALFDVEHYGTYVALQSESALRHLASSYAYDDGEADELTLRGGGEGISAALHQELSERLAKAGVAVDEARLTHLAYAPEIAAAMLRRQQAEAVIAARRRVVDGAVSMVEMALRELSAKQVVQLDEERKAAMVSNLLVVLCGEAEVHPVINTGTLYS
jgi:regulator of protease activity HflC (stomatin/prohibitin superfamily)